MFDVRTRSVPPEYCSAVETRRLGLHGEVLLLFVRNNVHPGKRQDLETASGTVNRTSSSKYLNRTLYPACDFLSPKSHVPTQTLVSHDRLSFVQYGGQGRLAVLRHVRLPVGNTQSSSDTVLPSTGILHSSSVIALNNSLCYCGLAYTPESHILAFPNGMLEDCVWCENILKYILAVY